MSFLGLAAVAHGDARAAESLNARLCAEALRGVQSAAAARGLQAEARCRPMATQRGDAAASLQAQGVADGQALRSGPLTWSVRVQGGSLVRVPLNVAWSGTAWISERPLAAGAWLRDEDLHQVQLRWAEGQPVEEVSVVAPAGRLKRALRAGEPVTAAVLLDAGQLQRGDRVTLVLSDGSVEMRMPARLSASARVGEEAAVQPQGSADILRGRLVDAKTVVMESP